MPPRVRICILTRDPAFGKTLERLAHQQGFQIHTGVDGERLDQLVTTGHIEALVMELPPSDGGSTTRIERLRAAGPDTVLIAISADPRSDLAAAALRAGLDDYLRKPFNADELFERIRAALARQQRQRCLKDSHQRQQITIEKLNQAIERRSQELLSAMKALKGERLQRRTTQLALRRSEAKFKELLDTSPDLIYILDRHGRFRYISPSVGDILGISEDELIGHHFSALLPSDHLPHAQYHFRERRTRQRATRSYEIRLIHKHHNYPEDVETLPRFHLFASGIYSPSGQGARTQYIGTCGIAREVSRIQSFEHRLLRTEEAALIGQLALSASRRLNSPLQGVVSLLAALDRQATNVSLSAKDLALLRNGMGEIGHIAKQMGSLQVPGIRRWERFDLTLLVADTIELLRCELQLRKINCDYRLAPAPLHVFADRTQLRQLFTILVNNAMDALTDQYGPRRGRDPIQLRVFTDQQDGGALVRICDNGPGLRREDLPFLFEPFFSRKPQTGAGLGLYLAKGIVTAHGGRILAANNIREHAAFSVHLPLAKSHLITDP
jgi:PAS domain S-box-containing protein